MTWSQFSGKDRQHTVREHVFNAVHIWLGLHIIAMIFHKRYTIEMCTAIEYSHNGSCKHMRRLLLLYGDPYFSCWQPEFCLY